jgi:multidrug resistance protein, MATE family
MMTTPLEPLGHRLRHEARAMWKLAWPILIGQIAAVGMAVSDTVMAGRLGSLELAAVSVGISCWTMMYVTLVGLMLPINAIVAHEYGAKRPDRVASMTRQALWMALAIGVVAMLLLNAGALLIDKLDAPAEVRSKAIEFVHIISLGLPALTLHRTLYGYSASIDKTKPMMLISLAALAYNVLANWLLIYGHAGFPRMGSNGCALATATGLWLMAGGLYLWIRRDPAYRASNPFDRWEAPRLREIAGMLRQGVPMGITYLAEASAFSAVALLVARFGVVAIASNQITINVTSVVFVVPLSFGIAIITRVGQALGAGEPQRARFVAWVGIGMAVAFGALSGLAIALFRHDIASLYSIDPAVQLATASLLVIAALFQLSDATQIATASAVRGYKVTRPPMVIHLCSFWGVAIPLGCLLGLGLPEAIAPQWDLPAMGVTGFWIGLAAGLSLAAVWLVSLLRRVSRQAIEPAALPATLKTIKEGLA